MLNYTNCIKIFSCCKNNLNVPYALHLLSGWLSRGTIGVWKWWWWLVEGSLLLRVTSTAPGKFMVVVGEKIMKFLRKITKCFLLHLRLFSFILDYIVHILLSWQHFCSNAEGVDCFLNKKIWDIHTIWMETHHKSEGDYHLSLKALLTP